MLLGNNFGRPHKCHLHLYLRIIEPLDFQLLSVPLKIRYEHREDLTTMDSMMNLMVHWIAAQSPQ